MPAPEPRNQPATPDDPPADEATPPGLDATGGDGNPHLRDAAGDLTAAQAPAGSGPVPLVLSPGAAAELAGGLAGYAAGAGPLDAPQLQVLYRYTPTKGPACFDLNPIHESVWRRWPGADALPERVDVHTFLGLLDNLPDPTPWAQPVAPFAVVGFSLCYDASPEPGPVPAGDYAVRDEPARVLVAVDADQRRYHHVHQAGATPGRVAVWQPTTIGPVDTPNRLTCGDSGALQQLHRLMNRLRTPTDLPAGTAAHHRDRDVLQPGVIVTVTADEFDEEDQARLWVVVDRFIDYYAIAVLGGDGHHRRPHVARGDLVTAAPQWIRRTTRHDGTVAYSSAATAPVPVDEVVRRRRTIDEISADGPCLCRSGYANNPTVHANQVRTYGRCSCTCHSRRR